jgi:hypothetical protein
VSGQRLAGSGLPFCHVEERTRGRHPARCCLAGKRSRALSAERASGHPPRTSHLSRAAHPARFALRSLSDTAAVSDPGLFISLVASRRGGPRQASGSLARPLRKRSLRTRVARGLRPCSPTRRGRRVRAAGVSRSGCAFAGRASFLKAWHADVRERRSRARPGV